MRACFSMCFILKMCDYSLLWLLMVSYGFLWFLMVSYGHVLICRKLIFGCFAEAFDPLGSQASHESPKVGRCGVTSCDIFPSRRNLGFGHKHVQVSPMSENTCLITCFRSAEK